LALLFWFPREETRSVSERVRRGVVGLEVELLKLASHFFFEPFCQKGKMRPAN
jgi:hypothetical protein